MPKLTVKPQMTELTPDYHLCQLKHYVSPDVLFGNARLFGLP